MDKLFLVKKSYDSAAFDMPIENIDFAHECLDEYCFQLPMDRNEKFYNLYGKKLRVFELYAMNRENVKHLVFNGNQSKIFPYEILFEDRSFDGMDDIFDKVKMLNRTPLEFINNKEIGYVVYRRFGYIDKWAKIPVPV